MAALTVVDVFGRDVFGWPLPGGYELTELLLVSLFFLALPAASLTGEHITVTLIDRLMSPAAIRRLGAAAEALIAVLLAALTWRIWLLAEATARYGDVSLYLEIPSAPFAYLAAAMTGLSALVFAGRAVAAGIASAATPPDRQP